MMITITYLLPTKQNHGKVGKQEKIKKGNKRIEK